MNKLAQHNNTFFGTRSLNPICNNLQEINSCLIEKSLFMQNYGIIEVVLKKGRYMMANRKKQSTERPQKMADSLPRKRIPKKDLWMRGFGYIIMALLTIGMIVWLINVFR